MKIISVKIDNFLAVKEAEIPLCDTGLVLIQGENKTTLSADSNGAGKSSLADAICWGIWGVTARGESGNSVIRHKTKAATVIIEIDGEDGNVYTISRTRKKGSGTTEITSTDQLTMAKTDLSAGTEKLNQAVIEKIMGCSYDVFIAANYIGQSGLVQLPTLTDKNLKLVVEEAAGINALNAAYEQARVLMNEAQSDLSSEERALAGYEANLVSYESELVVAKSDFEDGKLTVEMGITRSRHDLKTFREGKFEEMRKALESVTTSPVAYLVAADKEIQDINDELSKFNEKQERHTKYVAIVTSLNDDLARARSSMHDARRDLHRAESDFENIEKRVGQQCTSCGSIITKDTLEDARRHAAERVSQAKIELDDRVSLMKKADDKLLGVKARSPEFEKPDVEKLTLRLAEVMADKHSVQRKIDDLLSAKKHLTRLEEALAKAEKAENPYAESVKRAEDKLAQSKKKVEESEKKVEELRESLEETKCVVQVFGPSGVRAQILDQVTPLLNERTAHYLATLTDGDITAEWTTLALDAKGNLKEKFCIDVKHVRNGASYGAISGGEKQRVSLACAFAMQDLVSTRSSKPLQLLIADEIDDAMDTAGLERLMIVLQEKAKDKGSMIVVSHNDLKSWIGNVWTVTKTDDGSTVKT